jgi:hypothetical protein
LHHRNCNSFIKANALQEVAILPGGRDNARGLSDGQTIPVPVVRVVIDGVVTHEVRWSHPNSGENDSHSGTAGPLISASKGGVAVLRNMNPTVATCLIGCQRLPMRVVRAEGDTSGAVGTMQHGSLCMLVIYGV